MGYVLLQSNSEATRKAIASGFKCDNPLHSIKKMYTIKSDPEAIDFRVASGLNSGLNGLTGQNILFNKEIK